MTQIILQWQIYTLGIKHSTARSIVANYLHTGRCGKLAKGGYTKNGKVDDEKRQELMRLIEDIPILTRWYR